jgi:hypothetical protein
MAERMVAARPVVRAIKCFSLGGSHAGRDQEVTVTC